MARKSQRVRLEGPLQDWVEIGTALTMAAFGAIVIFGSLQVGINWGVEGPKAGFFPFYLGLVIIIASAINLSQIIRFKRAGKLFAEWGQLRQVLAVVVPTALYVAFIPVIGIYISSFLMIAVFMKWLGRYGWGLVLSVSAGVPVITYFMFERWFLIPLPKGPIEELLRL